MAVRMGVGNSLRCVEQQTQLVSNLLRSSVYQPDDLLDQIAGFLRDEKLGMAGFYLFSFNQIDSTMDWKGKMLSKARTESGHA